MFRKFGSILRTTGIGTACAGVFASITGFLQDEGALATLVLFALLLTSCNVDVTIKGEGSGRVVDLDNRINCTITNGVATRTSTGELGCVFRVNGEIRLEALPAIGFGIDNWIVDPSNEIEAGCGVGSAICVFTTDGNDVEVRIIFDIN